MDTYKTCTKMYNYNGMNDIAHLTYIRSCDGAHSGFSEAW